MTEEADKQEAIRSVVEGYQGKRPRLDLASLQAAAAAGRKTLLPAHVNAEKIIPDPVAADLVEGDEAQAAVAPARAAAAGKRKPRARASAEGDASGADDDVKTTLRLRPEVLRAVRVFALNNGTSLNNIVRDFLEAEYRAGRFR